MNSPPSRHKKATSPASTDSTSAASSVNEDISQQVDPSSATITVTAVEVEELSEVEQSDRLHLERRVERAFLRQVRHWQNCAIADCTVPRIKPSSNIAKIGLATRLFCFTEPQNSSKPYSFFMPFMVR